MVGVDGQHLCDQLKYTRQLALCLKQLRSRPLVQLVSLVDFASALSISEAQLLLANLLVGELEQVLAVGLTWSRSRMLPLVDDVEEFVLDDLPLGLFVPEGLLDLSELALSGNNSLSDLR